jgi:small subunit ribosomal protein S6
LRLYESMFLVDNARAKEDLDGTVAELREMVERVGGEIVNCDKWDEKKLAYAINGQRRGTYVLCHWNGPPGAPAKLERACRLSALVLRVLNVLDEDGIEIVKPREDHGYRRDRDRDMDRDRGRGRGRDRETRGGRR